MPSIITRSIAMLTASSPKKGGLLRSKPVQPPAKEVGGGDASKQSLVWLVSALR
jgi:hypothetical protein